ncbi:MAG: type 2 lantipeptide synthetase LanM [Propionibacteriaceae bacterium]|nr:type 2 lantipeptide synthetase LanM [Propionibacteriaceae bacterium]
MTVPTAAAPTRVATTPPHDLLFAPVLHGWVRASDARVGHHASFAPGVAEATLLRWQTEALYTLHLRALTCHLRLLSRENSLAGGTPEDRYRGYCADFGALHSSEFDACFAPLVDLRAAVLAQHAAALDTVGVALDADRAGLEHHFGIPRHARVTAVAASGDTHDGARRVCILTFDSGHRVVYKPRSVAGETGWFRLTAWLTTRSPLALPSAPAWDCGGHGWVAFVPALAAAEENRLLNDPEFLRRGGALTAVMHALNAKDMHRENLRITPAGPLPLDLETVLHVAIPAGSTHGPDDVWAALGASVSASGLLPTAVEIPAAGGAGWADVGFLATEGGGGHANRSLTVINPFRDDLQLSFETDDEGWEHPYENRSKAEAVAAAAAVADGFTDAYRWLATHRDVFAEAVTRAFAGARLRYLHGQTQDYVNVLRLSCAAQAAADPDVRRERLRRVADLDDATEPRLVEAEIAQLWFGHVPLFTMDADAPVVMDADGHPLTTAQHSPLAACRAKIDALSEADLAQQLDLIWASFVALHPDNHLAAPESVMAATSAPTGTRGADAGLAALARELSDDLVARARPDGPPERGVSWLGPVPSTDNLRPWAAGALDFDLYSGRTGVALALAQASVALGHDGARQIAERVFDACASSLDADPGAVQDNLGVGCWTGATGLSLALSRAGELLGRDDWRAIAASAGDALAGPAALDVIEGQAGDLLARRTVGAARSDLAQRLADTVVAAPRDDLTLNHSGYAHGIAGVLHAVADSPLPDGAVAEAIRLLLARLEGLRTPDGRAWFSSRFPDPGVATAWCHGGAGIALGVAAAWVARPLLIPTGLVDDAVAALGAAGFGRNLTLCHGDPGNWAIARWIADRLGHDDAAHAASVGRGVLTADRVRAQLADRRNRNSLNDTLMVGRAGVLLHLTTRLDPTLGSAPLTAPTTPGGS